MQGLFFFLSLGIQHESMGEKEVCIWGCEWKGRDGAKRKREMEILMRGNYFWKYQSNTKEALRSLWIIYRD